MKSDTRPLRNHVLTGLTTLAVLGSFLAADVGVGYWKMVRGAGAEEIEGVHAPHPTLGWALQPGQTGRHRSPGNFEVSYGIDESGLRRVTNRGEARHRIWLFGDSFTFGHGVADEETFASVMAAGLLPPGVHVRNAGVMGYGIAQQLQRLMELEGHVAPGDLVLFAPISRDLERSFKYFRYPGRFLFRESRGSVQVFPDLREGELVTAALDTPWNRAKALLYHARFTGPGLQRVHQALVPPRVVDEARTMLEIAREIARRRGASFELLFLPHPEECLVGRYRVDVSGFAFRDLMGFFPSDAGGVDGIRFPSDSHWNARGHAMAARAIVESLDWGSALPGDERAG